MASSLVAQVAVDEAEWKASRTKLLIATLANVGAAVNFSSIEIAILLMRHGQDVWEKTSWTMSVVDSLVFVGCIFGMLSFGWIGDVMGRLAGLRLTMIVAVVGILASLAPLESPGQMKATLMCSRFVVGVGCGGCYPLSAALAYEREKDPKLAELSVAVANFGQPVGNVALYVVALALFATPGLGKPVWRVVLLFGALPFVAAILLTLSLTEDAGGSDRRQPAALFCAKENEFPSTKATTTPTVATTESLAQCFFKQPSLRTALAGACLTWFAYNTYTFGIVTFYPQLSAAILGDNTLAVLASNLAAGSAAVLAAALSLAHIKRSGARSSVISSTAISAVYAALLCTFYSIDANRRVFLWLFILLRGLIQWPGIGVFAIPNTFFPRSVRSRTHGIASAVGKLGAILGSASYPYILNSGGGFFPVLALTSVACAATSLVCATLTPARSSDLSNSKEWSQATGDWDLMKKARRYIRRLLLTNAMTGSSEQSSSSGDRRYSELDPLIGDKPRDGGGDDDAHSVVDSPTVIVRV